MKKVLSIDLNSKNAKVGIINQYGEVENKLTIDNNFDNLVTNLTVKIKAWLEKAGYDYQLDIERIGVAVPGFVDHHHGVVKLANALNWKEVNIREILEKGFKKKRIYVLNNANAKALGEFWTGAATRYHSELFYSIGTRVGGAIVIDGRLILGEHGFAGEFGHSGLSQDEETCECGLKNCLQPVTSTIGITRRLMKILQENPHHPAHKYFDQNENLNFDKVIKVYHSFHKPLAIKNLWKELLRPLVSHIATMISAIDPKSIIISGDILALGTDLIEIIQEELEPLVPDFERKSLVLKMGSLGKNAGMVGAAYFAINNWDE